MDDRVQYFRITPGSKFIINNVGGRNLKFGPQDPPRGYVTALGEYDCVGPMLPLTTLFPKVPPNRQWWTHQEVPHQKWIFNTPDLSGTQHKDAGFCFSVTDVGTGKTVTLKLRVGMASESSWT
ncbi:hypothetical protein BESB_075930 [Besnoitia besnoiti]|uniref:Uncharacterized protein n=1 Tax=Besnoitia besnoiti TaxID=94643 RepID=A0A2A9MBT7_BESBE|nr:hypothetical protein BESB_075930 [Besnoitia besnoiti]PFH33376.1 hypothetical protein BESB_075930 [Besnoitia besnoiti]